MATKTSNVGFVIKVTDKKEGGWGYIWNGCPHIMGKSGAFTEDNTFSSIKDAENHIKTILNNGWYRNDITRECFEILPVKQYQDIDFGFFWYTEDCYSERMGNCKENMRIETTIKNGKQIIAEIDNEDNSVDVAVVIDGARFD